MSANTSIIISLASKLGLSEDNKIMRKATEYERLLSLRLSQASNINCTAKTFICLDLAATKCGASFDMMYAIKLSGLKKSIYLKTKHMAEKLLNLNESLTVKNFCIMNDCVDALPTAEKVIDKYRVCDIKDTDISHPQFVAMAVYQSCRLHKIKVPKAKFLAASNLKPSLWARLEEEWTAFVNKHFGDVKQTKKANSKIDSNDVESWVNDLSQEKEKREAKLDDKEGLEDYDTWKARILRQAYKELKEQNSKTLLLTSKHLF